jgi:hypothetical protein
MFKIFFLVYFIFLSTLSFSEEINKEKMSIPAEIQTLIDKGEFSKAQASLQEAAEKTSDPKLKEFYLTQDRKSVV